MEAKIITFLHEDSDIWDGGTLESSNLYINVKRSYLCHHSVTDQNKENVDQERNLIWWIF